MKKILVVLAMGLLMVIAYTGFAEMKIVNLKAELAEANKSLDIVTHRETDYLKYQLDLANARIAELESQPPQVVEKIVTQNVTVIKEVPVTINQTIDEFAYYKNWHIGQDIVPSFWGGVNGQFDCDDATLYSYYWISFIKPDYKITIMTGINPDNTKIYINGILQNTKTPHVWLIVDDGQTKVAYSNGQHFDLIDSPKYLQGTPISLSTLIQQVHMDIK